MSKRRLHSLLRSLRRKAGLSQRELCDLVGYGAADQVSRHERGETIPHSLTLFAYSEIFKIDARFLFSGVAETVSVGIEERIAEWERALEAKRVTSHTAGKIARQRRWLQQRKTQTTCHEGCGCRN